MRFNSNGWINATPVAKKFGKEPNEWLRLPETIAYMAAFAKSGIFPELVRTKRGRTGGTWLHPKLAVAFARWLSPEFAVWCDMQIDGLLRGEAHRPAERGSMSNIIPFDYQGQLVRFKRDGWIDATSAAKRFDKEPTPWLRQIETLEYLLAQAESLFGKSVNLTDLKRLQAMKPGSGEALLQGSE